MKNSFEDKLIIKSYNKLDSFKTQNDPRSTLKLCKVMLSTNPIE